jgi:membrane protein CcdC involved in cytochrome C biogenesis
MSEFGKGIWAVIGVFILIIAVTATATSISHTEAALPVIFFSITAIVFLLPFALLAALITLVRRRRDEAGEMKKAGGGSHRPF